MFLFCRKYNLPQTDPGRTWHFVAGFSKSQVAGCSSRCKEEDCVVLSLSRFFEALSYPTYCPAGRRCTVLRCGFDFLVLSNLLRYYSTVALVPFPQKDDVTWMRWVETNGVDCCRQSVRQVPLVQASSCVRTTFARSCKQSVHKCAAWRLST